MNEAQTKWRGDRMRELREAQGWTLFDLAVRTKSQPGTLQRYEKGRMPPVTTLMALCRVFSVNLDYLLNLADDPSPIKDKSLPPDWLEAVKEIMELRYGPDEVVKVLRALRPLTEGASDRE